MVVGQIGWDLQQWDLMSGKLDFFGRSWKETSFYTSIWKRWGRLSPPETAKLKETQKRNMESTKIEQAQRDTYVKTYTYIYIYVHTVYYKMDTNVFV